MATSREDKVTAGVREAWDFWLSQHDVSVPATIEEAISKTFGRWLDANADAIIAAIAEAATKTGW